MYSPVALSTFRIFHNRHIISQPHSPVVVGGAGSFSESWGGGFGDWQCMVAAQAGEVVSINFCFSCPQHVAHMAKFGRNVSSKKS